MKLPKYLLMTKKGITIFFLLAGIFGYCTAVNAQPNSPGRVNITLQPAQSGTVYVNSQITDLLNVDLLVDTGSSFTIFDQFTMDQLSDLGLAEYKNNITGVMADGSEKVAQVYILQEMLVGNCRINNLEVVAFTSKSTFVLGINALKQLSPFSIDFASNALTVHCNKQL